MACGTGPAEKAGATGGLSARAIAERHIYLPASLTISAASVLMAPPGARAAHRMDVRQLRRVFAALLFGLAACMIYKALNP